MYPLITTFYVSFIVIILMILSKRREAKTGYPTILSRLGRGSDHVFSAVFSSVSRFISYINRHTFIALFQWIVLHILKKVRAVYVEIKHRIISTPKGKKLIDAVRGRGEVRDHGASFYLRRISGKE